MTAAAHTRRHLFHRSVVTACLCGALLLPAYALAEDENQLPMPVLDPRQSPYGIENGLQPTAYWKDIGADRPAELPRIGPAIAVGGGLQPGMGMLPSLPPRSLTERSVSGPHLGASNPVLNIPRKEDWQTPHIRLFWDYGPYPGLRYDEEFEIHAMYWPEPRETSYDSKKRPHLSPERVDFKGNASDVLTNPGFIEEGPMSGDLSLWVPVEPPDAITLPGPGKKKGGFPTGTLPTGTMPPSTPIALPAPVPENRPPAGITPPTPEPIVFPGIPVESSRKAAVLFPSPWVGNVSAFSEIGIAGRPRPRLETFLQLTLESKRYVEGDPLAHLAGGVKWKIADRWSVLALGGRRSGGLTPGSYAFLGVSFRF
jgi:hypothetical protein